MNIVAVTKAGFALAGVVGAYTTMSLSLSSPVPRASVSSQVYSISPSDYAPMPERFRLFLVKQAARHYFLHHQGKQEHVNRESYNVQASMLPAAVLRAAHLPLQLPEKRHGHLISPCE